MGMEDKILKAIERLSLKFDTLSEKVDNQGNQLKENIQILKALEHLAQVNKAEHDKMSFDIAEMNNPERIEPLFRTARASVPDFQSHPSG